MQVCYYRDKNSINKFQKAKVTAEGVTISDTFAVETKWNYKVRSADADLDMLLLRHTRQQRCQDLVQQSSMLTTTLILAVHRCELHYPRHDKQAKTWGLCRHLRTHLCMPWGPGERRCVLQPVLSSLQAGVVQLLLNRMLICMDTYYPMSSWASGLPA